MKVLSLEELIIERSKRCGVFSNPLRSFIATFIAAKEEATWSELKTALERVGGPVNPNTLSFHITVLMSEGFVDRVDIRGQPRYRISEKRSSEIETLIGKDVVERMRRELSHEK